MSCTDLESVSRTLLFSPPKRTQASDPHDILRDLARTLDPELLRGDWLPPLSDFSSSDHSCV